MNLLTTLLTLALASHPGQFQQGPEHVGASTHLSGQVIGMNLGCALVLADTQRPGWERLGGGVRFFYCADNNLEPGDRIDVCGRQVSTRRARVGPRWRVLPVYVPAP